MIWESVKFGGCTSGIYLSAGQCRFYVNNPGKLCALAFENSRNAHFHPRHKRSVGEWVVGRVCDRPSKGNSDGEGYEIWICINLKGRTHPWILISPRHSQAIPFRIPWKLYRGLKGSDSWILSYYPLSFLFISFAFFFYSNTFIRKIKLLFFIINQIDRNLKSCNSSLDYRTDMKKKNSISSFKCLFFNISMAKSLKKKIIHASQILYVYCKKIYFYLF